VLFAIRNAVWWLLTYDEVQTMSPVMESCPLTMMDGGLSQLHSADDTVTSSHCT